MIMILYDSYEIKVKKIAPDQFRWVIYRLDGWPAADGVSQSRKEAYEEAKETLKLVMQ